MLRNKINDYRIIPFGFVIIYILALLFSEFYLGSYAVIGDYFRIHPLPYFVDLKILLCGIDAIREGVNPYNVICYDGFPYFNYPLIWGVWAFVPFATTANLLYIGFGLALVLFSSLYFFIGKINLQAAIIYTLLFLSPAIMLGVERGNCDLMIFLLLLIPLLYNRSKGLLAFVVLVASLFKIFPIGAIVSVLNNRLKKSFWFTVSAAFVFLMYLILMRNNILLVSKKTPRPFGEVSYGLGGIPSTISALFDGYPHIKKIVFLSFIIIVLAAFIIIYRFLHRKTETPVLDSDQGNKGVSYLIGAGIFITTCLIGFNWEYRLIFLLFTIPQLLSWVNEENRLAKGVLIVTILVVWQSYTVSMFSFVIGDFYAYLLSQLLVIILFYGHLYILLAYVNSYYKKALPFLLQSFKRR